MKKILVLFFVFFVLALVSVKTVNAQSCGGGTITGADFRVTCPGCNEGTPGCNCSYSCSGVTLAGETCSDYNTCGSCNAVSFSGYDCGNKGSCSWSTSCGGNGGSGGGASCNDGIQNQGESGVDCGGPCNSCDTGGGGGDDGGGGGGGGCVPGTCWCQDGGAGNTTCGCVRTDAGGGCLEYRGSACSADSPPGCSGGGGCSPSWGGCSASCGNGRQTDGCGGERSCCSECGPNYGACTAPTFTRTGTYNCGAGPTTQACTGTITGTLFDATLIADCSLMAAAPKIPGGRIVAVATQNGPAITYTSGASNASGVYSTTGVRIPDTYSLTSDMSGVSAADGIFLNIPRLICQASTAQFTTQSQSQPRNFGYWKVYDSWFQVIGGNIRADSGGAAAIESRVPPTCVGPACSPYLLRRDTASTVNSAGFAIPGENGASGGTVISAYSGGDLSKLSEEGFNVKAYAKRQGFREDYDYFINKLYSMGVSPVSDFSASDRADFQQFNPSSKTPVNADRNAYYANGDVTISQPWAVPAGQTIVIFVNGNLTISNTITVTPGGFLAIIASGNISVANTVGTASLSSETPLVEGVYIADGTFTVERKGAGSVDVSDLKFIGAGTFVGWTGVNLNRTYKDTATPALGVSNNTNPTELFVARPDFAFNAPEEMKRPQYTWQEVEP